MAQLENDLRKNVIHLAHVYKEIIILFFNSEQHLRTDRVVVQDTARSKEENGSEECIEKSIESSHSPGACSQIEVCLVYLTYQFLFHYHVILHYTGYVILHIFF